MYMTCEMWVCCYANTVNAYNEMIFSFGHYFGYCITASWCFVQSCLFCGRHKFIILFVDSDLMMKWGQLHMDVVTS